MIKRIAEAIRRAWDTWCEQSGKHLMIAYGIPQNDNEDEGKE